MKALLEKRKVFLGDHPIFLQGKVPKLGDRILTKIKALPARRTKTNLTEKKLLKGLVIVSTLPNIRSHACSQQVLDLEIESKKLFPKCKIFHIASDPESGWEEVDKLHPFLKSPGFTLTGIKKQEKDTFKSCFGVGVCDHHRMAHGLFALLDGEFIAIYIPRQQLGTPNIKSFLNKIQKKIAT